MNVSKHDPDLQASESHGPRRQRRRFAWIGTAASLVIFAASIYVLWHMGAEMNAAEVKAAFTAATARQLGTAAGLTATRTSRRPLHLLINGGLFARSPPVSGKNDAL